LLFAQKKAIPLLQLFMHALMQTKKIGDFFKRDIESSLRGTASECIKSNKPQAKQLNKFITLEAGKEK
jgi:hypothetical protein